ncbi:XRN_N domain-containing protein, partial [Cephalotus follicularis]
AFVSWLVIKYPNVVVKAVEEDGDPSTKNPNGLEFDNLYLDMNGIIHPCFHPDDHPSPPTTREELFNNIFECIDHLFSIVRRPTNLLYMAIDGVAPRAKMNQQRSRLFRTAKDKEIAVEEVILRRKFEMQGKQVLPKQVSSELEDSTVITPGTEFMFLLSMELKISHNTYASFESYYRFVSLFFIRLIILSDANVPGEGEHKIMTFIRLQRTWYGMLNCAICVLSDSFTAFCHPHFCMLWL